MNDDQDPGIALAWGAFILLSCLFIALCIGIGHG